MPMFEPDETIFADELPLRENWQPDRIQERDEELTQYKAALQPVINEAPPKNLFLYGKTGVGKTVATRYVLDHLQEDAAEYGIDLTVITQPCNSLNSSYQVAVALVNQFRSSDNQLPSTGYPQQDVFNALFDELDKVGGIVLIVLDEIDNIGDDDDLLYELPRAEANGYVDNVWPGVIGISNDFTFRDQLSPKVKSTLCEEEIRFAPYNANELQNILQRRVDLAFHNGVVDGDVVPLAAAFAAQDSGNARQGLRLLHKAGELARGRGDDRVTTEHLQEAKTWLDRDQLEEGMREMTTQVHFVLCAVAQLAVQSETPSKTQHIYETYTALAEELDANVLSERRVRDHLSELSMQGVLNVNERNTGIHGGSYYEYEISVDLTAVLDVLLDIDRLEGVAETLEQQAQRRNLLDF